jgi:3D (Asp-Asp-Asp) domain-containing protein
MRTSSLVVGMLILANGAAADAARPAMRKMQATAYCQTGKTSSGVDAQPGIVAADPRVLPAGTIIDVNAGRSPYTRRYIVSDTGAAVKGKIIDIFIADCRAAKRFGRRSVRVAIVGPVTEALAAR